ncbi:peritrophin-1-like [Wyeomyia smithii]|uniref:peritrophin-1-like n=1 Tax=Wyeomyia smithii TaxID=174621 RepID=UPI002467C8FE|nr:peritrophin-1-like [Wyeomyia smithii]
MRTSTMNKQTVSLVLTILLGCCYAGDSHCPEVNDPENVLHFPHPTDCSKFLTCNWGSLVEQRCPDPLLWNDDKKYCDHAFNVNCDGLVTTTKAAVTGTAVAPGSTSATTSTNAPNGNKCPETHDPDQPIFLPHTDCNKFYICSWGGVSLELKCPPGLHWNVNQNYCDYPELAGCAVGSTVVSTESTTAVLPL